MGGGSGWVRASSWVGVFAGRSGGQLGGAWVGCVQVGLARSGMCPCTPQAKCCTLDLFTVSPGSRPAPLTLPNPPQVRWCCWTSCCPSCSRAAAACSSSHRCEAAGGGPGLALLHLAAELVEGVGAQRVSRGGTFGHIVLSPTQAPQPV